MLQTFAQALMWIYMRHSTMSALELSCVSRYNSCDRCFFKFQPASFQNCHRAKFANGLRVVQKVGCLGSTTFLWIDAGSSSLATHSHVTWRMNPWIHLEVVMSCMRMDIRKWRHAQVAAIKSCILCLKTKNYTTCPFSFFVFFYIHVVMEVLLHL